MTTELTVSLSHDEALVLYEWLSRAGADGDLPAAAPEDLLVLWRVEGQLERQLTEPLLPGYPAAVEAARARVRRGSGEP